ncbi:MAG: RNA methyltransferase [Bacteroidetes bacterium]|nr:RNA methyltransferase [Bacteroidota bacterium]MBS1541537.1 RNA methyltransferase [Bacteroidota bacterium]
MTTREALTRHLGQYITEHKKAFIERVLNHRTRYVTLVLEDIFQSQNASATVRTAECMGLQDIHIIEHENKYGTNKRVLKGSNKWIDMHRYKMKGFNNTEICFRKLRESGYKILVTDPSPDGIPIDEVPIDTKLALVMGNELHGASDTALQLADEKVFIPMYGFTESFNISVSAAICLNVLLTKVRNSSAAWALTPEEKEAIQLQWYRKVVRRSDLIEQEFLRSIK